jgi:hypothetical protein
MKYIQKFERSLVNNVWVVSIKMPDFEVSLWKIGMNDEDIKHWVHLNKVGVFTDYGKYPNVKTITMSKNVEYDVWRKNSFTWYPYPTSESSKYTIFMGKIEITPKDIQDYNDYLEIKDDAKKYNI